MLIALSEQGKLRKGKVKYSSTIMQNVICTYSVVLENGSDGFGFCDWMLTGLAWFIVIVTFPLSFIFCIKRSASIFTARPQSQV
ncbi:hypothetical protein D917_08934 [Trichinella nativa]|uniref:Uncharacterized protein n=1 Tax=Trichinella nativa TaxID=6335 RepID=A0A1Y3EIU7_9BILA|nr:hypothetical protein D917_08934 [Trichinella nativa]